MGAVSVRGERMRGEGELEIGRKEGEREREGGSEDGRERE